MTAADERVPQFTFVRVNKADPHSANDRALVKGYGMKFFSHASLYKIARRKTSFFRKSCKLDKISS